MKRYLLFCLLLLSASAFGQVTYYWVGSAPTANANIGTLTNWNTAQNGTGTARVSNTGATDILIFDGTNLGGATPVTGPVTVNANTSITAGQLKFVNNADISMVRPTTGTSTITLSGEAGEDFVIDAGATLGLTSTIGSIRIAMAAVNTGRVSGTLKMITTLQARIDNTTSGTPGSLIFTSGASLYTNITSASSSYAFGNNTQSSEKWVVFESGSHLYYDGGYSPMSANASFSPIDFKPGSTWHHRANNGTGSFLTRRSFGNIIVENNATLTADGPIYRIGDLTVNSGSSFVTWDNGQTPVFGNIVVNGAISSPVGSTNDLLMAGSAAQTISGTGTISVGRLLIGANSTVTLSKTVNVDDAVNVFGRLNLGTNQITGTGTFRARGATAAVNATANTTNTSFMITGNTAITSSHRGMTVTGAGIAANTMIVALSFTGDSVYLSQSATATATGVALQVLNNDATLQTSHTNGFNPAGGSLPLTGTQTFDNGINYVINGATTWPFGITTASTASPIQSDFVEIGAAVTTNRSFSVNDHLSVNGKLSLRAIDSIHLLSGSTLNGTFSNTNYIALGSNSSTGEQSSVRWDGINAATNLPLGTSSHYLPVILTPASAGDFRFAVFQGITTNGLVNGTALTPTQKQTVVDAVWNINRLSGTGNSALQLAWTTALEGSTFTTLPNSEIGVIVNTGSSWTLPIGTGDNSSNIVNASITGYGAFGVGAVPPTQPFVFNPLPVKTYGDADFNGGATSLNTTQPIVYTSSNPLVATIVAGNIHITGAGTSNITASQASDGFYPAASVTRELIVNKTALTITADNKTKFEQTPNPVLTATYTGFVLGETPAVLLTPAVLSTTAVTASPPGTYPITVAGATSNNYTITFVNGTLTVQPKQNQTITFNALPTKTYGNADFATGATSTNNTIPITYASSNTSVATIVGNNIHIVGAGTANITASQAGNDGYFPAANVTRLLTVNKANLTIRVRDTTRVEGEQNPVFTITYTGFVLGETGSNLLTPVEATTTATPASAPGFYPITLSGATSNNYNITMVNGRLTVLPAGGSTQHLNAYMSNSNTLTIRVYSNEPRLGDIMLFDMSGRPLVQKNLFMPVGFASINIQIPTVPNGIYIVRLKGENIDLQKTIPIVR